MKEHVLLSFVGVFLFSGLCGAQSKGSESGLDLQSIDKTVDPCQDFYQYACGNWVKQNPVPPQYARWGRFDELADRNEDTLHDILEEAAKHQDRSANDQKIGAFYASCMNESEVDKAGDKPLKAEIELINKLPDVRALAEEVARLHNQNVNVFFGFGSSPDPDNSKMAIAEADQGGLGLPEKDYYTRKDAKSEETRAKYVLHIAKVFELLGDDSGMAGVRARAVMAVESTLAAASLSRVERRNPTLLHHKMSISQFEALTPNFNFDMYFAALQSPKFREMNVTVPDYFRNLKQLLQSTGLNDLKSYLVWQYATIYTPALSKGFVDSNFDFYGRYLTGAQILQPRWKRCVKATDRNLGEALGQAYVAKAFSGQSKEKTQELVVSIEQQMETDIKALTWMSDTTKEQALTKLRGVTNKIGYPARWRDYSGVNINKKDYLGNIRECREFEARRDLGKIGKPVDRMEYHMTPSTVNAYYSPLENNINFPAGILQPPFYSASADMAVNYGAIGAVIGHELTHGFDDQGRQFDADGNLRDWWTQQDSAEFKERVNCIADEYAGFSPIPGVRLNGRLTLGENGADNAGIRLAFMALTEALAKGTVSREKVEGYSPQQRFFLANAQVYCQNVRPEEARHRALVDPHSPGEFRVDGVVENAPEFATAFGCTAGQPMVAAKGCRVW